MRFHRPLIAVTALTMTLPPIAGTSHDVSALVQPASTTTVDFYFSAPFVQGTFQAGAITESFNSLPTGSTTSAVLSVGTVTSGSLCVSAVEGHGGAVTTSAEPVSSGTGTNFGYPGPCGSATGSSAITITLATPRDYFGFYWSAGDPGNRVDLLSNGVIVATLTTSDIVDLLPPASTVSAIANGSEYNTDEYYGNPRDRSLTPGQPFAYVHAVSTDGSIDQIRLTAGGFEFDNLAIATLPGAFDPTGLVGVPLTYALAYDSQGGSSVTEARHPVGAAVTLASPPTKADHVFTGWFSAGSGGTAQSATFTHTSATNVTLYAQWAPIVTFDANGGSGNSVTQSATGNAALTANTFTRAGYTFAGWNTTISGTGTSYSNGGTFTFTTPVTLYAQWTLNPAGAGPQVPLTPSPATTGAPSTTTPPTTTPAATTTTAPSTTIPAPVPDDDGVLPVLQPGEANATQNGAAIAVEVFLDDSSTLVMRGRDFQLNLAGDCAGGCTVVSDETGRETIELRQDGNALVDGFGFMPGTLVHIWMFSEPTYLGSLLVADDGTFEGSVYLAGIAPGTHTLQVNGISFDGNDRSANLGVVVVANTTPVGPLPATGGGTTAPLLVLTALAMIMLGALARRRA